MSVSAARTIVLPAVPNGVTPQWPMIDDPDSLLDYSLDYTNLLADVGGDTISSASVSVKPSGTGELQAVSGAIVGAVVTANVTGGAYGRYYWVKVEATSASGRVFSTVVQLRINPAMMVGSPTAPPSTGWGAPLLIQPTDDLEFLTVGG
jgi:hypothetical protein